MTDRSIMNKKNYIWVALGLILFQSCGTDKVICDGRVAIEGKGVIRFSKNEKQLLCGNKDMKEWRNVPLAQTEITIKEFLKGRGYYNSVFTLQENGEQLHVDAGVPYVVQEVKFFGQPEDFDDVRYIGWKNRGFTPGTLDDIQGYTLRRLKELGYACAQVKIQAIIETQVVQVHINPEKSMSFLK
ncbi:MAG: hypothetical protein R2877_07275 [Bdellovibrionota bacterium]